MKLGATDFLLKPVTHTELIQVIDNSLKLDVQRHADQKRLKRVATLYQSFSRLAANLFDVDGAW